MNSKKNFKFLISQLIILFVMALKVAFTAKKSQELSIHALWLSVHQLFIGQIADIEASTQFQ